MSAPEGAASSAWAGAVVITLVSMASSRVEDDQELGVAVSGTSSVLNMSRSACKEYEGQERHTLQCCPQGSQQLPKRQDQ